MGSRTGNGSKPGKFIKTVIRRPDRAKPSVRMSDRLGEDIMNVRPCGDCQACCVAVAVHEIGKGEYEPCRHQCSTGCGIYAKRPGSCRVYACGWKVGLIAPGPSDGPDVARFRPDRFGAILDLDRATDGRLYVRVWQLDGPDQMATVPALRHTAWRLADQLGVPVFAYHHGSDQRSIWLIPRLRAWGPAFHKRYPDFPIHILEGEELLMD